MNYDYDNTDLPYVAKRDPRELNVVENIKNESAKKAELPRLNEDPVCMNTLERVLITPSPVILKSESGKQFELIVTDEGELAPAELVKMSVLVGTTGLSVEESNEGFIITNPEFLTLQFSKADPSVGRHWDGWWFYWRANAPTSMKTEADFTDAVYTNQKGGAKKNFWSAKDSKDTDEVHFLNCWCPITQDTYDKFLADDAKMIWNYTFCWNKASTQNVQIIIDPKKLTLLPA